MSRDVNLTSREWCELVFEGKNQKYGAYYLRKTSSRRHIRALLIVITAIALAIFLPTLIKQVIPDRIEAIEGIDEGVKMTQVDLEETKPEQQLEVEAPPPPALKEAIQYVPPVISKDATDDADIKTAEDVAKSDAVIFTQDIKGSDSKDAVDPGTLEVAKTVTAVTEKPKVVIHDYAEVPPSFPGGEAERIRFLNANIRYPKVAEENDIQGRVVLRIAVMENGTVNVVGNLTPDLHSSLIEEATRLAKLMPKWIPGKQNGKPVSVYYNFPVTFKLQQR